MTGLKIVAAVVSRCILVLVHPIMQTILVLIVRAQQIAELVIRFHIVRPHGFVSVADLDSFKPFIADLTVKEVMLLCTHPQILITIFAHVTTVSDVNQFSFIRGGILVTWTKMGVECADVFTD